MIQGNEKEEEYFRKLSNKTDTCKNTIENNTLIQSRMEYNLSPEDRFYINLNDFLDLLIKLLERNKIQINHVVFTLAKTYIEKMEKDNIIKLFIEGSLENGKIIWDSIAEENTKFCIDYFIRYVNNITNINIKKLLEDKDPEKLFFEIFSEDESIRIFWSYMRSFVRIALNYIKLNSEKLPHKVRRILTGDVIKKYTELFKKQNC
jgi:hypothetical protein